MKKQKGRSKAEYTKLLLTDYFDRETRLRDQQKQFLYSITRRYKDNHQGLFELYLAIHNKKEEFFDKEANVACTYQDKQYIFQNKGKEIIFEYRLIKDVLGKLVDLTEDILPLGTLVQLKKEFFSEICDIKKVQKIWVVITYRYLKMNDESFYTYGGIVYPVANFNKEEILKFTPALIEKVIYRGFSDVQEDAYVYLMKQELIIENGKKSAGINMEEE